MSLHESSRQQLGSYLNQETGRPAPVAGERSPEVATLENLSVAERPAAVRAWLLRFGIDSREAILTREKEHLVQKGNSSAMSFSDLRALVTIVTGRSYAPDGYDERTRAHIALTLWPIQSDTILSAAETRAILKGCGWYSAQYLLNCPTRRVPDVWSSMPWGESTSLRSFYRAAWGHTGRNEATLNAKETQRLVEVAFFNGNRGYDRISAET